MEWAPFRPCSKQTFEATVFKRVKPDFNKSRSMETYSCPALLPPDDITFPDEAERINRHFIDSLGRRCVEVCWKNEEESPTTYPL